MCAVRVRCACMSTYLVNVTGDVLVLGKFMTRVTRAPAYLRCEMTIN